MSSLTSIPFQKLLAATSAAAASPLKSFLFKPIHHRSLFNPISVPAATPFRRRFAASFAAAPSTMGDVAADSAMDAVQRRLMFEDEFVPSPFISLSWFLILALRVFEILGFGFYLMMEFVLVYFLSFHLGLMVVGLCLDLVSVSCLFVLMGWIFLGSITLCRCILVDENDHVVGHESKYNCKSKFLLPHLLLFTF